MDGFLSTGELRELPAMQGISLEVRHSDFFFIGNSGYNSHIVNNINVTIVNIVVKNGLY